MKEKIFASNESITVGIMGGEVASYRKKQEEKTTVRIYKDGYIGVAGAIGECDERELEKKAEKMLDNKIAYPCVSGEKIIRSESGPVLNVTDGEIVKLTEKLLARLAKETPDFLYSQSVRIMRSSSRYECDNGSRLSHRGEYILVGLIIKDKSSANVFDASYFVALTDYDEDKVVADVKRLYDAFHKDVEIEDGEYIVSMNPEEFLVGFIADNFEGEKFSKGASLLSGKTGEKLFSEKVTMYMDYAKEPEASRFFDAEGTVLAGDRFYLVKDGEFCGVLANKRVSALYNLPLSGSASAAYDTVPGNSLRGSLIIGQDGRSFDEIVKDETVILPLMASGGDYTKTGDFSTPVQLALVYKNGKFLGRVKGDFGISCNFFDMLGKNFVGSATGVLNHAKEENVVLVRMNVKK